MTRNLIATLFLVASLAVSGAALAQDNPAAATYADIEATLGVVPSHFKAYPTQSIAGAWEMTKSLLTSPDNSLEPKVKSLINLAVAAQIPCTYCIWLETKFARQQGATEAEISEAVAQAAYVRHWSTVLNGMQIDFETFKAEFGGE
ncbi:MAG: carboxymuconolactone decarboxylase family protein [Hyphomicrobiales bacterium]|nr:MAG: carboxymuconolactone decarboxylase family protein [Hyphomicrobiales bacterium]